MDILSLLLFIVFIVIPLVNSVIQRVRGGPQKPQQQGRPQQGQTQQGRTQQGRTQPPGSPSGRNVERDDELAKRIEEARQRVRQAMEEDEAPRRRSTKQREATLSSPFETDRAERDEDRGVTLFRNEPEAYTMEHGSSGQSPTAQTSAPRAFLPREGSSAQPAYTQDRSRPFGSSVQQRSQPQAFLPSESETAGLGSYSSLQSDRKAIERAPAMQVSRRGQSQTGTLLKDGKLLTFERNSILRGYVWHEILSEPRSKKRRKLSRR